MTAPKTSSSVLDVRGMRKPDKHPAIFGAYDALAPSESFVLVNDHDPRHLRAEFEVEHPGGYVWEYLSEQPRDWQIRITKLTATPLPHVVADTRAFATQPPPADAAGAIWTLQPKDRDLDASVISLAPGATIDAHTGPDLDILVHVLAGSGELGTETGTVGLEAGQIVWLPRRSQRRLAAGTDGLRYLTVHRHREGLAIGG